MIAFLLRCVLDPRLASHVGAALVGHAELGPVLERVCEREAPRCRIVGVHEADRWMERTLGPGMGTRGAWGTVAAFTVEHLPAGLRDPWWLDVPLLGAIASARRMLHPDCRRYAACRRWRGW